ncbi:hypothetical protein PTKIN_Ptkin07bG0238400 [Pterospermum kingtungense]
MQKKRPAIPTRLDRYIYFSCHLCLFIYRSFDIGNYRRKIQAFNFVDLHEVVTMTVSLEALAMAGVDYNEWGLDIEKWEGDDSEWPPQHLLAEEEPERVMIRHGTDQVTYPWDDFDGNASNGGCRYPRVSQSRILAEKIIESLIKLMLRYMIMLLIIARIDCWEEEIS